MADLVFYHGLYSGQQIDSAVARALSGGTLDQQIAALRSAVGSPLVATTAAQMTNTNKIYVYTGSEAGYIAGNWYYNNGSAWTSGGVYNAVAVDMAMSSVSDNAVANRVVTAALADVAERVADIYKAFPTETVSGGEAVTALGADNVPIKSLIVNIALKAYGTGTPSPTNIRRFAAFDKAVISQMDGNGEWQTDASAAIVRQPQNYVGAIGDTATFAVSAIGATAYRWQFNNGNGWLNSTSSTEGYNTDTLKPVINATRLGYLYRCRVTVAGGYLYSAPAQIVETGTTPADLSGYVDYIPDYAPLVTVDWSSVAGTIYGAASINVLTGVLTAADYEKDFDGSEDWVTVSGTDGNPDYYYWIAPTAATFVSTSGRYCSHFVFDGDIASSNARVGWRFINATRRVIVRSGIEGIETVDDWKAWLAAQAQAGTPLQIYLARTEPRTYQLSTNEVMSLLGDNTIRANAGNVDVVYRCDPTLYIESKIAAIGG